jgi:hypothetical protein|nr:hypothetical protein [Kofleriaceae bacterium]
MPRFSVAVATAGAVALTAAIALSGTPATRADTKSQLAQLEGATVVATFTSPTGFIDDPVAGDATRLAYFVSDASTSSQLHVVTLAAGSDASCASAGSAATRTADGRCDVSIELAPVTAHPVGLELVGASRAFVIGALDDGNQIAALVELKDLSKTKPAGTVVYKLGPAQSIVPITRDGKRRVAVHRTSEAKDGGVRHEVDVIAIESGQRVASGRALELDKDGGNTQLEFHVNHWSDGMTRAYGIKGGTWDRKENQRTPDVEAAYDLITGKFETKVISDLFEQHKRYQVLADANAGVDFVRMSWDMQVVQIWSGGVEHDAQLDQSIVQYDPKSLQGLVAPDGSAWIVLKVDPVNADAVGRKHRDPEYLDIFRATPDGKATRKMRVLATNARHRFGVIGDKLWLLERNNGFERGGKALTLYTLN